ncbi:hypothetical protein BDK61_4614 [Haloarcula quadrata]|jgi:hypothetical protein|uniref:Uncharacterized protein n=2 Tax=Haloarcula TaxID=2237 RepID=M0JSD3_9EURY|nr:MULTISPECIES: hypothetical protein [Haloarcula]EMA11293.1 hypothetical protein C436_16115 [Haloarcula sinaiiensis ATCC 33800]NHX41862.1 hypothetical protein [Haloarcula sp. R1-2]QUJ73802.1 hypothetical protein KDQ40_16390 [Haloarcula sinaiiensis ATCC 33800]RKS75988.1 hypothetical protein BDK61_4614 [Haloarcula quadrata]
MKSGAGSPFEDDFDEEEDTEGSESSEVEAETESIATDTKTESDTSSETSQPSDSLPYKYRRDGVQDGRSHANLFLREEAEEHVEDVVDAMEETFETESVYKIDVLEAIVLAANEDSRTVADELRKMGYGMK